MYDIFVRRVVFSDGSVETGTFSASAINTTSIAIATRNSYENAVAQCTLYLNTYYYNRTLLRAISSIKTDSNVNFGVIP